MVFLSHASINPNELEESENQPAAEEDEYNILLANKIPIIVENRTSK